MFPAILCVLNALDGASMFCACLGLYVLVGVFILSSGVFNRTPSHICGGLYLPLFLLRMGSFTLIKRTP